MLVLVEPAISRYIVEPAISRYVEPAIAYAGLMWLSKRYATMVKSIDGIRLHIIFVNGIAI